MNPGKPINFNKVLNFVYIICIIIILTHYYRHKWPQEKYQIAKVKDGHLKWNWYDESKSHMIFAHLYLVVAALNFIGIGSRTWYSYVIFLVYYVAVLVIRFTKSTHVGEIWCYFANAVPLILLVLQTVFCQTISEIN